MRIHRQQRLESGVKPSKRAWGQEVVQDVKQFLIMGDESCERSGSGARLQGFCMLHRVQGGGLCGDTYTTTMHTVHAHVEHG